MKMQTVSPKDRDLKPDLCVYDYEMFIWNYKQTSRVNRSPSKAQTASADFIIQSPFIFQCRPSSISSSCQRRLGCLLTKMVWWKYTMWRWRLDSLSCTSHPTVAPDASAHALIQFLGFHGIPIKVNKLSRSLHIHVASTDTCCSK